MCKKVKEKSPVYTFLEETARIAKEWYPENSGKKPWFRALKKQEYSLVPSIYRHQEKYDEIEMTSLFRNKAYQFGAPPEIERSGAIDEWLALMQHHGLPTRLMDWTENPLIALFFVVGKYLQEESEYEQNGAIWILNPLELNRLEGSQGEAFFPNTWADFPGNKIRYNLQDAFGVGPGSTELPIAVYTTYRIPRQRAQVSCFTVHGKNKGALDVMNHDLLDKKFLIKYIIKKDDKKAIENELEEMGISYTSVLPELDGLAKELKKRFENSERNEPKRLHNRSEILEAESKNDLISKYDNFKKSNNDRKNFKINQSCYSIDKNGYSLFIDYQYED